MNRYYLRDLPVEALFLFLPVICATCLLFLIPDFRTVFLLNVNTVSIWKIVAGNYQSVVLALIALYAVFFVWRLRHVLGTKKFEMVRSVLFLGGGIILTAWLYSSLLRYVFLAAPEGSILLSTIKLVEIDKAMFGNYIYFSLHSTFLASFERLVVGSYWFLAPLFTATSAVLLFLRPNVFRRFIFATGIIGLISVPIWLAFPATSPSGLLRSNIFHLNVPADIVEVRDAQQLSPYMKGELAKLDTIWIEPSGGYYNVSTIPSLHAGYGFLIVLFSCLLSPWLLLGTIPWFILNCIGAIYIEQHFGIDILAGIILALAVFVLTSWLYKKEQSYFEDRYGLLSLYQALEKDSLRLRQTVKNLLSRTGRVG